MDSKFRSYAIWIIIIMLMIALVNLFSKQGMNTRAGKITFSQFLKEVEQGKINEVTLAGQNVSGKYKGSALGFKTFAPENANLVERLYKKVDIIKAKPPENSPSLFSILISWFPMLLLIAIWIFFMRQMQGGGGKAMGFGKSKAKLLTEQTGKVMFKDVAGVQEAKAELSEIVDFLREPQKFQRLGAKIPRGALLVGPPGTGKTLLARAVAGESGVPFFTISGSDFVEMFVGVGASRVRDMFEQAKANAPCIIFIDEIDAVGRHRGAGMGGGNDEREQTLNQLLVEMDGFEENENVILIAATNRPDVLDKALLRPGRFDRQITVPNPDIGGREKILNVHMKKLPLSPDVKPKVIARGTPGFSGADLANLVNEAALLAARRDKNLVTQRDFEDAKDKVMMGTERKSMIMSDEEKENTAYHEAGHAIVGMHMPGHDPLHKVTIIPRGQALGMTVSLPETERHGYTLQYCVANLASLFGGREAEIVHGGEEMVTNGATGDIQQATRMARAMVTEWGMSEKLGRVRYSNEQETGNFISAETSKLIEDEIRGLIETGEQTAKNLLDKYRDDLHTLAQGLLEYETLSAADVKALLKGDKPVRESDDDGSSNISAVPSAGHSASPPKSEGLEPQPS